MCQNIESEFKNLNLKENIEEMNKSNKLDYEHINETMIKVIRK